MIRTAVTWRIRWEPHGVGLDRGPWGVGEADELTLRPNPSNRNATIYRYHQVPLAGKRSTHKHMYNYCIRQQAMGVVGVRLPEDVRRYLEELAWKIN